MDLNFLIFLGSARDSSPPKPARLGLRVARACLSQINSRTVAATLVDPLDYDFGKTFKPHFAFRGGKSPAPMEELAASIEAADGYVMVSPEYNHSMSPALAHLLNHFGSSLFSYKPSAIVTYSAGQWGGARAAVGMRAFLSELGCLPVSAMVHIPKAQEVFDEDGRYLDTVDTQAWATYTGRTFDQLVWWATAAKNQHAGTAAGTMPGAFKNDPSQRNAP
jgi:NAD(P)H-dependent FMN reductase